MAYNETMRLRRVTRNGGRVVLAIPGQWAGSLMTHSPRYPTDGTPWLLKGSMMRFKPEYLRTEYRPDDAGGRSCTWCGQWTRRDTGPVNNRGRAQCSADDCFRLLDKPRTNNHQGDDDGTTQGAEHQPAGRQLRAAHHARPSGARVRRDAVLGIPGRGGRDCGR